MEAELAETASSPTREGVWLPTPPEPLPPYLGKLTPLILAIPLIATFLTLYIILSSPDDLAAWVGGLGTMAGFLFCGSLYLCCRRLERLAIRGNEANMLLELNARHGVLVSVWILQGRAITGIDRGLMWVEDNRLCFCGHRTSFSLGRGDVLGGPQGSIKSPGTIDLRLDHDTPVGPLKISFSELIGSHPFEKPIRNSIRDWCKQSDSTERGQLPPTVIGLSSPSSHDLRKSHLRRAFILPTYLGLLLFPFFVAGKVLPLFFGLYAIAILALLIAPTLTPKTALRDRRLIESSES